MKNLLSFLFAALIVAAMFTNCKNSAAPGTEGATADTTAAYEPVVEGYWVNKAWWETLQSTKSPYEAAKKLGVAGVTVSKDSTDAWIAWVNYAFHEGMEFRLQPAEGGHFALLNTEDGTVGHQFLFNADSTVYLDSFQMVRIGDGQMDDMDIQGMLISGNYMLKGKTGDVNFASNGSLTGIDGYETYEILFDYVVNPVGDDELMLIKPGGEERDFFVFEIKGNQLLLSPVEEITDKKGVSSFKTGPVKYELTKK